MQASDPIPCEFCGTPFRPDGPKRRFCCHHCAVEATKVRSDMACAQCGTLFHPKTYTARFCSASCVAKYKHAHGMLRRKLTAERLDRLLRPPRRKRPYRMRLTAVRFDRMVGG